MGGSLRAADRAIEKLMTENYRERRRPIGAEPKSPIFLSATFCHSALARCLCNHPSHLFGTKQGEGQVPCESGRRAPAKRPRGACISQRRCVLALLQSQVGRAVETDPRRADPLFFASNGAVPPVAGSEARQKPASSSLYASGWCERPTRDEDTAGKGGGFNRPKRLGRLAG